MRARLLYAALKLAERLGSRRTARSQANSARPILRPFEPGVSVVIPERENPGVLAECLERVAHACDELSERCDVIVVVNGSRESRYRTLIKDYKQVRWLFSKDRLWYCGAVRRGLRDARYDWVYLLNSDMLLDSFALESMMKWRSPRVFAIASQVFFREPADRREETGWTMFRTTDGPIEILDEIPDDERSVRGTFYAGGGASLFRRYLLEKLVRDSSVYAPFYWEDVEWGARAWRLGYESLYCPASKARHLHRMTNRLFFTEAEIDRIMGRNRFIFHFRNGPPLQSYEHFLRTLDQMDERSLEEIVSFSRIAQIAAGRFQSSRLPIGHIALDRTWEMRYGLIDEYVREP
jgi:GT2 family glycosyltransferase